MEKKIVEIFDVSYEGSGVGKVDGQIVFVPKTLIGEKVEVEIVKANKNFLTGKVVRVIKPSEMRIVPRCPYFDVCGGCDFQHCGYQEELRLKKQILIKELSKVVEIDNVDVVSSSERFGYRNKLKLEVDEKEIGYFKAKSHDFFAVSNCPIATAQINQTLPKIREFLGENNLPNLKSVYIKLLGEKLAICFLFSKNAPKITKNLKKIEIFDEISVFFAYGNVLESDRTTICCVYGKSKLDKQIADKVVKFDVSAFNQINDAVAEKLYDFVLSQTQNKRVVNAYSGQGVLTYLISKSAKFVYGIEYQKSAHLSAESLISEDDEYKMQNICGKVEDCLRPILQRDKIDVIVLDPARDGCKESVLKAILDSKIEKVVYVSCNFATLSRDLKILTKNYTLQECKMFDMFPCTANMETVVVLGRTANLI